MDKPIMTRRGGVDKRFGGRPGGSGGTRGPWSEERRQKYQREHPVLLRSYDDWGFSSRDEAKFAMMLRALAEDAMKRKQEAELQLSDVQAKRIGLQTKLAQLECQLSELHGEKR